MEWQNGQHQPCQWGNFATLDVLRPYLPDLGLPSMEATMFCTDLLEFPFRKVIQDPRFLYYLYTYKFTIGINQM